jgi:hypothetical protein
LGTRAVHLWATGKLADEIAAGTVSSRDKMLYFVLLQVLAVAIGYAVGFIPFHASWMYVYEAVVVIVITFAGARRVTLAYQGAVDGGFFEMAYLLSVPLTVKTTVASWVAIWGGTWLIRRILEGLTLESADAARAVSYWGRAAWELVPFVVAAVIAVVFWYRLAHHVAYIIAKKGA